MSDLKQVVSDNFARYAGNVILDRAICDVRDMLKPSARMLMYSQVAITKNIPSKPFVKSARVVGDCLGHYYTHGDGSCYATYMRMVKPFAMRYPLESCQGNCGTITATGDEAASRYTELRISKLGYQLFEDINKDTIELWNQNFDETETYPSVLCSKGFYNIVNGSTGIGVSLSASIPQFNIREINEAMINLINNPNAEIDIMPDFATGAILINAEEVKESLKVGHGRACKLRSVVEYDKKENAFIVKELPYGVYTSTISKEIADLVSKDANCGIEKINDGSGKTPDYMIYLSKKANPTRVLKLLFKETSLQSHFTINMTVLTEGGRKPKVLGLKEMLQAHIDHEKEVYRRGFEFDLKKIEDRLHIIEGLLKVIEDIDNVVKLIKSSESTSAARQKLMESYNLDEAQTKAILDMKLSRLAHLEVEKLKSEKSKLEKERDFIYNIINNEDEFNAQLIKGWREVADKFGDARRTQILNISKEDEEPTETHELLINLSNQNNIYVTTVSTLYTQRRGGVGNKFKMSKGEYVISTSSGTNLDTVLLFSNKGNCYHINPAELQFETVIPIESLVELAPGENIKNLVFLNKKSQKKHIIFLTKNGILKKSNLSEYNIKRKGGVKALNLDANDEIVSVLFLDDERIGMLTACGQFVICESKDIRAIGRVARGVKGIGLNADDYLVCAGVVPTDTKEILTISEKGYIKRTSIKDFAITGRGTKGSRIHKLNDADDRLVCWAALLNQTETIIVSSNAQIKINLNEVNLLSKGAQGTKSIKLSNAKVIGLLTF